MLRIAEDIYPFFEEGRSLGASVNCVVADFFRLIHRSRRKVYLPRRVIIQALIQVELGNAESTVRVQRQLTLRRPRLRVQNVVEVGIFTAADYLFIGEVVYFDYFFLWSILCVRAFYELYFWWMECERARRHISRGQLSKQTFFRIL